MTLSNFRSFRLPNGEGTTDIVPPLRPSEFLGLHDSFLDNPKRRETFESAHSVILAVLAHNGARDWNLGDHQDKITTRLAPFYLECLLRVRSGTFGLKSPDC
jgi:hypothetical protein